MGIPELVTGWSEEQVAWKPLWLLSEVRAVLSETLPLTCKVRPNTRSLEPELHRINAKLSIIVSIDLPFVSQTILIITT